MSVPTQKSRLSLWPLLHPNCADSGCTCPPLSLGAHTTPYPQPPPLANASGNRSIQGTFKWQRSCSIAPWTDSIWAGSGMTHGYFSGNPEWHVLWALKLTTLKYHIAVQWLHHWPIPAAFAGHGVRHDGIQNEGLQDRKQGNETYCEQTL